MNNKLFVYGIFLDQRNREDYGMTSPQYAVVPDYVTVHLQNSIVEAVPVPREANCALTGLVVDVDPTSWRSLDALEHGYKRALVTTQDGRVVNMYRRKDEVANSRA